MRRARVVVLCLVLSFFPYLSSQPAHGAISAGTGISTDGLLFAYDAANLFSYTSTNPTNLYDLSGNNKTATLTGSPTYFRSSSGSYFAFDGGAYTLFNSGDHIDVPDIADTVNFRTGTGNTVGAGFSFSFFGSFGSNVDTFERIFDFGGGSTANNIWFGRSAGSGNVEIETWNGSSFLGELISGNVCNGNSTACITTGLQQYTVVLSSSGSSIYLNGNSIASNNIDMRPVNAARTINYIGRSNWNDAFFEGGIYRIAFYNKALTGSEVAQNYSSMIDTSWPTINGSGSYNVYETSTAVTSLTSSESVLFYEKTGSGDSGSLSITTNGVVTFDFLPNYENYSPNQIFSYYVNVLDSNGNYSTNILTLTLRDVAEFATISFNSISAPPIKGVPVTVTITPSAGTTAGKVTYLVNGKRIPNCYKRTFTGSGNSTCSWKPANRGWQELTITFTPNGSEYGPATLNKSYFVNKRTTTR